MASLEELLKEEGFKSRMKSRTITSSGKKGKKAVSMPLNLCREQSHLCSTDVRIRMQRTESDFSQLEPVRCRRSVTDVLEVGNLLLKSKNGAQKIESSEEKDSYDTHEDEKYSVGSYENLKLLPRYTVRKNTEFQEKWGFDDRNRNDVLTHISSNSLSLETETLKDNYRNDLQENEGCHEKIMDLPEDGRYGVGSPKSLLEKTSKNSQNKRLQSCKMAGEIQRNQYLERMAPEPVLDESAVRAMILILSGYVKHFLKDGNFRTLLRRSCLSCLSFTITKELNHAENGVVVNFKQAVKSIERVVEEMRDPKELKKASLQLSVIAGLNSKDLKDGFTFGIPNSHLAACAHLYLGVIYKLQKKDKVSAKHLLQVFCDSPFQARKNLSPDLWNQLFLPHLSHLRIWYDQEAEAIPNTPVRLRKMKLLDKFYNEILDSGTYQIAIYYRELLTSGIEAPTLPSIHVPARSICGTSRGGPFGSSPKPEPSPIGFIPSQPMISKRLYESVFSHFNKLDGPSESNNEEGDELFTSSRCFNSYHKHGSSESYFPELGTHARQLMQEGPDSHSLEDALLSVTAEGLSSTSESACGSRQMAIEDVKELKEGAVITHCCQNSLHSNIRSCVNCEFKKSELASTAMNTELPITSSSARKFADYGYFERSSFLSSIPKDFICPLTGELFENPVTLETGQTFERAAIKEWLDRGNMTCPVTGKSLECPAVPVTNIILKRVINGWKSGHCKNLLILATQVAGRSYNYEYTSKDEAAIIILEQLLTGFNTEERMENAKHLISLGGLEFLIRRFELGDLEEKTSVAALLSCCIMADGCCRNYIARNIKKPSLMELLHNKQPTSRTNAILLLTELICLNRRTEITLFLSAFQNSGIMDTLHVLLVHLQNSSLEKRPLVAVLILHFDLMAVPRKYSIYREEAVDAIIVALEGCLLDEKVREHSCRALFILGGKFSYSGEAITEAWLLKEAGFCEACLHNNEDEDMPSEEEKASEEWQRNLTVLLLGNGKKSFLECVSKCLGSGDTDLVGACLTTVAWLSYTLASVSDAELQLSTFSILIPMLKQNLEQGQIEHRVLSSLCLLNFSKISECRLLLMTFAGDILDPIHSLTEVTWTAERLWSVISG